MIDKKLLENLGWSKELIGEITRTSRLIADNYPQNSTIETKPLSSANFSYTDNSINVSTVGIFYKP
jgi:hypothetical protein